MHKIFVFGSNLLGIHGAGSAKRARDNYGARWGVSSGRTGNSFAIPTKESPWGATLSLNEIEAHVQNFLRYARQHPELHFKVVAIGCGLAGFKPEQIAPMFKDAPPNCELPLEFIP